MMYLNHYGALIIFFSLFLWIIIDSLTDLFTSELIKSQLIQLKFIYQFGVWLKQNWKWKLLIAIILAILISKKF